MICDLRHTPEIKVTQKLYKLPQIDYFTKPAECSRLNLPLESPLNKDEPQISHEVSQVRFFSSSPNRKVIFFLIRTNRNMHSTNLTAMV